MSKRKNIFKDITEDTPQTRSALFNEAYKIHNFNSCPEKDHKNNDHNPWCLHGLGQEVWFDDCKSIDDDQDHFTVRPKYFGRYSGLRNLGATCYVNSLTQILCFNQHFRETLYKYSPKSDKAGSVIRCLQQLFVKLEYSARGVVDTTGLVTALQLPFTEQQDVVEFRELLFGLLINSMPSIQDRYKGEGRYVTRCMSCGNVTDRSSDFTDLKLQLKPKNKSITERIRQLSAVEILEGDNSYYCSQCHALRQVERCYMIKKFPQTLQLQLLRFNYNSSTMQRTKNTNFVKFDENITLFNHTGDNIDIHLKYKLSAIILHVGETTQSGHYIAIIRQNGKWITFNDETVYESCDLDLRSYDLNSVRKPACQKSEYCSQSVYMLVYDDVSDTSTTNQLPSPSNPTAAPMDIPKIDKYFSPSKNNPLPNQSCSSKNSRSVSNYSDNFLTLGPPPELLSITLADNVEFHQLRELLVEQKEDVQSNKQHKFARMQAACCKLVPPNERDFIPIPAEILKLWLKTGNTQNFSSEESSRVSLSGAERFEEVTAQYSDVMCLHNKLSYHRLKLIKYVNKDIVSDIFHSTKSISCSPQHITGAAYKERGSSNVAHPLDKCGLCEECVADDLEQHIYDITLDGDYKTMTQMQSCECEAGWWALKDDMKNFKKLVRKGGHFNAGIFCIHNHLDPDLKRRKLVSSATQPFVQKYFNEFPAPSFDSPVCEACSDQSDTEKLYFSSIFLLKKDLQRLISEVVFPFIPGLTPYIVPLNFIRQDLQPLFKKKLQERISLDTSTLGCQHSMLASDALDHAAFVKECEWDMLCTHFGPATPLRCDSTESGVHYTPTICRECVMQHDSYVDQAIYLREEKNLGKRGRRGDKILRVSSSDSVQDVKVKICRKLAIAPSEQTLSTLNGKILEHGTLSELGILPGCILYLEYNHALLQDTQIFDRAEEQGFKGTVLSGHL